MWALHVCKECGNEKFFFDLPHKLKINIYCSKCKTLQGEVYKSEAKRLSCLNEKFVYYSVVQTDLFGS